MLNLTKNSTLAIGHSIQMAADLGTSSVCSEHLLLGLLQTEQSSACRVLLQSGITVEKTLDLLRQVTGGELARANKPVHQKPPTLSPEVASYLKGADAIAVQHGNTSTHTVHILLSILQTPTDVILGILDDIGISMESLAELTSRELAKIDNVRDVTGTDNSLSEQLRQRIRSWTHRAEMARQYGRAELVDEALEHKKRYEAQLSEIGEESD